MLCLLIRSPCRTPLFPYTTLFRSSSSGASVGGSINTSSRRTTRRCGASRRRNCPPTSVPSASRTSHSSERSGRSEEHTSELQSLRHLVCRLLLEKKYCSEPDRC